MSEERGKLYWFRLESKEFTNKNTSRLRKICQKESVHWRIVHDAYLELLGYSLEYEGIFKENGIPLSIDDISFMFQNTSEEEAKTYLDLMLKANLLRESEEGLISVTFFPQYIGTLKTESMRKKAYRDKQKKKENAPPERFVKIKGDVHFVDSKSNKYIPIYEAKEQGLIDENDIPPIDDIKEMGQMSPREEIEIEIEKIREDRERRDREEIERRYREKR